MAVEVQAFLGRNLTIPEDRHYVPEEHLWVKETEPGMWDVGLTEAGVLMCGGVREAELLVESGAAVEAGQTVCLLLTGKVKYLASPLTGRLLPGDLGEDVNRSPYGVCLFRIKGAGPAPEGVVDAAAYARALQDSEGARNPGGVKGPGSSICRALYWGIQQQNFRG